MSQHMRALVSCLALGVGLLSAGSTWAEKPDWVENGRHKRENREDRGDRHGRDERRDHDGRDGGLVMVAPQPMMVAPAGGVSVQVNIGSYFGAPQRQAVQTYYAPQIQSGHCPPGLAKKHNGCLPPGQERKWRMGERMPVGVVTYPVPVELRARLGVPPSGYNYVRVGADILMIAVGTGLVVDAIQDLAR